MPSRRFTDKQELEIAKRYLAGESAREIGRSFGIDKTSIIAALRRTGTQQRTPAERNRLYKINGRTFDTIDSSEKAYWWGFLYADGAVNKRSLVIGLKRTGERHLFELRKFLESEHPISQSIAIVNGVEYLKSGLFVTDEHMTNRLRELGIIPCRPYANKVISNLPSQLISHWLRGYFDGDGYIANLKDRRGIKQGSIKILGQVELLQWIRHTVHVHCNTNSEQKIRGAGHSEKMWTLEYTGRKQCERIGNFLYKDATIFLKRKHDRFMEYTVPPEKDWWKRPIVNGRFVKKEKR